MCLRAAFRHKLYLIGVPRLTRSPHQGHSDAICKKASKRLYALRLLKRSALPEDVLITVYRTIIRPILEYACEAWHYSLPLYLSELLERIQKRALRIIFPSLKYDEAIVTARLDTLSSRRACLCFRFFTKMNSPSHKLHDLVPPRRDLEYRLSVCKLVSNFILVI